MSDAAPQWRQAFDAVEREVAPRLESVVRSDQFAVVAGLAANLQRTVQDRARRATRRAWHLWNLPAGTDVTRILNELGQLKQQVRELSRQVEAKEAQGDARRRAT